MNHWWFTAESEVQIEQPIENNNTEPSLDAIKIVYHPSSGRLSRTVNFEDYREQEENLCSSAYDIPEPWQPFRTRTDFEFAELVHEAFLTESQIEKLISLIHSVANNEEKFTIGNHRDLKETWKKASDLLTPVTPIFLFRSIMSVSKRLSYHSVVQKARN